jgi:hypothetical protein
LNAFAERSVRSVKQACLSKPHENLPIRDPGVVRNLVGKPAAAGDEAELRRAIQEWTTSTPDRARALAAPAALRVRPVQKK